MESIHRDKVRELVNINRERKHILQEYLRLKLLEEDWHGVQDAASDIRDLESKIEAWEELL